MKNWQSMAHVKWECNYHIVFIPKYSKKTLYGKLSKRMGEIFRQLCRHKGIELLEGHAMPDHVHMCLGIPPKYSVSMTIGYIKGKSAIRVHREFMGSKAFHGFSLLGPRLLCQTVGLDEHQIREYINNQEKIEQGKLALLNLPEFH